MKVLGYVASPRNEGNTAWVINKILESAKEAGAETDIWYSGNLDIRPCKGCLACVKGDGCAVNDDMQKLYSALKHADALVLGSPVYMGQMSGQMKIFTDRLFAQITPRFSPRFKEENAGKKLILVFTQGNPDPDMFKAYYDYTKKMFQLLEFDVKNLFIAAGTRTEQVSEKKELHAAIKIIGASLISQ